MEKVELEEKYNSAGYPENSPALVRLVKPLLERADKLLKDWEKEYFSQK